MDRRTKLYVALINKALNEHCDLVGIDLVSDREVRLQINRETGNISVDPPVLVVDIRAIRLRHLHKVYRVCIDSAFTEFWAERVSGVVLRYDGQAQDFAMWINSWKLFDKGADL